MVKKQGFYNPFERYEWVEYVEDDADPDATPFRARIRSNLTHAEVENLVWDSKDEEGKDILIEDAVWPLFAPFVVDWNLQGINDAGEVVEIESPSVGGPQQFRYIPIALFWALTRDIKIRSTGRIDPKRLSRREPAVEPTSSSDKT